MQYSRVYAEYITNLQYSDLPPEVVEKAKMHFLDALGNILGAHEMPWSQMVIKLVRQMKGTQESTVLGEHDKYPMINAALANGTMAHGIDADDSGARPSWAHPGACIIPAAFAAAEAENVSGKELITALVAGYEISCRVDSAVYPGLRNRGFHATGVIGTIGAVAAAGMRPQRVVTIVPVSGTDRPRIHFVESQDRDARDLLERQADIMVTSDPAVLVYADSRPELTAAPLAWNRTYVLLSTSRASALQAGAAGVSIGRNAFQHEDPTKMVQAMSKMVQPPSQVRSTKIGSSD